MAKVWTSKQADVQFSKWIRARDKACVNCGRDQNLQNSHFWSRGISATRYDQDNCVGLCAKCHFYWEVRKQGEYREFMLKHLGKKKYMELEKRARSSVQRTDAIIKCMELLNG